MRLILASASPRRADLLASAGFAFEIFPADVDESPRDGEPPQPYALRVARAKAEVVLACCRESGSIVLAADTVVAIGAEVLPKPHDPADAVRMLKRLSGTVHEVHTAVVVGASAGIVSEVVTTRVHLLPLSDHEIAWYVGSGEPEGKAGAYAIQGLAARFVDHIEGSWSNVVGLPIATVYRLLRDRAAVV